MSFKKLTAELLPAEFVFSKSLCRFVEADPFRYQNFRIGDWLLDQSVETLETLYAQVRHCFGPNCDEASDTESEDLVLLCMMGAELEQPYVSENSYEDEGPRLVQVFGVLIPICLLIKKGALYVEKRLSLFDERLAPWAHLTQIGKLLAESEAQKLGFPLEACLGPEAKSLIARK